MHGCGRRGRRCVVQWALPRHWAWDSGVNGRQPVVTRAVRRCGNHAPPGQRAADSGRSAAMRWGSARPTLFVARVRGTRKNWARRCRGWRCCSAGVLWRAFAEGGGVGAPLGVVVHSCVYRGAVGVCGVACNSRVWSSVSRLFPGIMGVVWRLVASVKYCKHGRMML